MTTRRIQVRRELWEDLAQAAHVLNHLESKGAVFWELTGLEDENYVQLEVTYSGTTGTPEGEFSE